ALVAVQHGVAAVAADAARAEAERAQLLAGHRLHGPAPEPVDGPGHHRGGKIASSRVELDELIRTRRTQKAYEPGPVDPETLDELFELARWAPNHHLTNPWRFRVLGPAALEALKAAADELDPGAGAKLDRA